MGGGGQLAAARRAVVEAHDALHDGDVGPGAAVTKERCDELGPGEEGVEVAPGAPAGQRVVAGIDEVGADLEARRAQAARGERREQAGGDRGLAGTRARPADDDARDHAAASTGLARAAARPACARRAGGRGASVMRFGPARPAGAIAAAPAQRGHRAGVVRAVERVGAVVGADGERPPARATAVAQRRQQRRVERLERGDLGGGVAAMGRLVGRADVHHDPLRAALDRVDRGAGLGVQVGVDVAGRAGRDDSAAPSSRAQPAAAPRAATTTVLSSSARGSGRRRARRARRRRRRGRPGTARPGRERARTGRRWPWVHAPPSAAAIVRAMPALAREPSARAGRRRATAPCPPAPPRRSRRRRSTAPERRAGGWPSSAGTPASLPADRPAGSRPHGRPRR